MYLAVYPWLSPTPRLISERTVEENILKKANQKRMLGDMAIEGGNFTTAYFKQVLLSSSLWRIELLFTPYERGCSDLYRHASSTSGLILLRAVISFIVVGLGPAFH